MKIFPAVHYTMGGLWCDYERSAEGGLVAGSPRNQQTNIPGLYAIGECEYQYHGANRLGANSLVACIFSGLGVAPGVAAAIGSVRNSPAAAQPAALYEQAVARHQARYQALLSCAPGGPNPYEIHQRLGRIMTETATVVRHNADLQRAYGLVSELEQESRRCSLADTGHWANQNAVFARALEDMFPVAKAILQGALARDECRGSHYKPEFAMPDLTASEPAERRRQAEAWCDRFAADNRKWLKTTLAACGPDGATQLSYEDVDTSLLPPRPRLYGLTGGSVIEEVWNERQRRTQS